MRHLFLLLVILGLVAFNLSQPLRGRGWSTSSSTKGGYDIADDDDNDEADVIVRRSYANSYAHLLPCEDGGVPRRSPRQRSWEGQQAKNYGIPNCGRHA